MKCLVTGLIVNQGLPVFAAILVVLSCGALIGLVNVPKQPQRIEKVFGSYIRKERVLPATERDRPKWRGN